MGKQYIERSDIGPCLLERQDLIELANVAQEGLPQIHGFEVLAEFRNTKGNWSSMEEFLRYEDWPDTSQELRIRAWSPKVYGDPKDIERGIYISFGVLGSYIDVSGTDETWVIGKHNQVARFFENRPKKFRFASERTEKVIRSDLFISVVTGLLIVGLFNLIVNVGLSYAILSSVASIYLMLKYLGWARVWKPKKVEINLKAKTGFVFLGMEAKVIIPIVISILALIVSVIRIFV